MRVTKTHPNCKVDIRGADDHKISVILLVTTGGVTATTTGKVTLIMHQHECHGKNKPIHSSPNIEHCNNIVDCLSIKVGGEQHIDTWDKH